MANKDEAISFMMTHENKKAFDSIELGNDYLDETTGYVGTATAKVLYLHDIPCAMLEAQVGGAKDMPARWYPIVRLMPVPADGDDPDADLAIDE